MASFSRAWRFQPSRSRELLVERARQRPGGFVFKGGESWFVDVSDADLDPLFGSQDLVDVNVSHICVRCFVISNDLELAT